MEIRFEFTEEDGLNALRASSKAGWNLYFFVLLLALLFLVGVYLIDHGFSVAGWLWLFLSLLVGVGVYEIPRFQVRKALKESPSVRGEIAIILNDKGTSAKFATGESHLDWKNYTKFKETESVFLLFSSPYRFTTLPKRVMSADQIHELRSLLRTRISTRIPATN